MLPSGLTNKKAPNGQVKVHSGRLLLKKKLKHRMNASKTKKEAPEINVFMNQKITHCNPIS